MKHPCWHIGHTHGGTGNRQQVTPVCVRTVTLQISDVLGKLVRLAGEVNAVAAKRGPILGLARQLAEAQVRLAGFGFGGGQTCAHVCTGTRVSS